MPNPTDVATVGVLRVLRSINGPDGLGVQRMLDDPEGSKKIYDQIKDQIVEAFWGEKR